MSFAQLRSADNTMKTIEMAEQPEIRTELKAESLVKLPYGLLGFEQFKNYVLVSLPNDEPFKWLQMVEKSGQGFLVLSPFVAEPDYRPDIAPEDVRFLGLDSPTDALLVNIVTMRGNQATINLKGPIVINRHTLVGKQVIPNNAAQFSLRHPLPLS
jgi:flagellar assembly factor FliW